MPSPTSRFVALDIRGQPALVAAVDANQRVVLKPRSIALGELEAWLRRNLQPTDAVVIDAPADAWRLHEQIARLASSVILAHPRLASLLHASPDSEGRRDTINLARLHAAGLVPALWVPPAHVRDMRAMAAQRARLIGQRAQARETLRAMLRRYALRPPADDALGERRLGWWEDAGLAPSDLDRVRECFVALNRAEPLIADVEARLARRAAEAPWQEAFGLLRDMPGMAHLRAAIVLAAIGDIGRFPSGDHLASYAGLAGHSAEEGAARRRPDSERQGGQEGRRELREAMLEAAWAAIDADPGWRATFQRLESRLGQGRAIAATARKLLLAVWNRLSAQAADESLAARKNISRAA